MRVDAKFVNTVILCVLIFVMNAHTASAQYLRQVWGNIDFGENIGGSNIWCGKLYTTSTSEAIVTGAGGFPNTFFMILQRRDADYIPVWISKRYDSDPINVIEIANIDSDDVNEIYVILKSGQVDIYAGNTMMLTRTVATQASNAKSVGIGDVDNDGSIDFVFVSTDSLKIYDANTFTLKWDTAISNANDVKVGDVDHDGNSEIVLGNGTVLDGKTHALKWSYAGGFGSKLQLIDVNGDGIPEILSSNGQYINLFSGVSDSLLWQINTAGYSIVSMKIVDLMGDSNYEILVGMDQWGGISAYSASTKQPLWHLDNPDYGITSIAVGDPDGDGIKEVIWGAGQASSNPDKLIIASSATQQVKWRSANLDGPFFVSVSDIDDDGSREIIGASYGSDNTGNIMVLNSDTHIPKWTISYGSIRCLATGKITKSNSEQIVIGVYNYVIVFDGKTRLTLWQSPPLAGVNAIELADVDYDGITEIVVGDNSGRVTIYNGETFEQKWQSDPLGSAVKSIRFVEYEDSSKFEIVILTDTGIQSYDGSTHLLKWQTPVTGSPLTMDIGDIYRTGKKEIVVGRSDGKLSIVDCENHLIDTTLGITTQGINSVLIANLDSIPGNEILIGTDTLKVIDPITYSVKWKSDFLGANVGAFHSLYTIDLQNDGYQDIVVATQWGMFQFRSTSRYPDITPPTVVSHDPHTGLHNMGTNTSIIVKFSKPIVVSTLIENNILVKSAIGDTIHTLITYDQSSSTLHCVPQSLLPPNTKITICLKGSITDSSGNGLDGNYNGIPEGSPIDDYIWSFSTGSGVDTTGPNVATLTLSHDTVWQGIPCTVHALVSDSTTGAVMSNVTAVEYFIDTLKAVGTGIPLTPDDGQFGLLNENVSGTFSTGQLIGGKHLFFIHGKDQLNNWGPVLQHSFVILAELSSNWPMFGQNPQHTGFNKNDSITLPLRLQWKTDLSMGTLNPLSVANDLIFASNVVRFGNAFIKAIDVNTGKERWSVSLGNPCSNNPPSFAYGSVYLQCGNTATGSESDSYLYAFDRLTGKQIWCSPFSAQWEKYLAPTISDGKVFIDGGSYGGMYAYDALTGQQVWFKSLNQYDSWTPAVYENQVYAFVGGSPSQLVAADIEGGYTIWVKNDIEFNWTSYSMNTAPVIDMSVGIIFTTSHDYLHAVELRSQNVLWKKTGSFNITPAVAYGKVFSINSGKLVVYDEMTGNQVWSFSGDSSLSTSPIVSNNHVFVCSSQQTFAVNTTTHESDWNYNFGGTIAVANSHLYISDEYGILYAFEIGTTAVDQANGTMPYSFQLYQNYPNPFNPQTTIRFDIPKTIRTRLKVYNIVGQEVKTLVDEMKPRGRYTVLFDARGLSSGVYFCRLQAGTYTETKKFILLR